LKNFDKKQKPKPTNKTVVGMKKKERKYKVFPGKGPHPMRRGDIWGGERPDVI